MMLMVMVMVHEKLEVRRTDGLELIEALWRSCTEVVVVVVAYIVVELIVAHVDVEVVTLAGCHSNSHRRLCRA